MSVFILVAISFLAETGLRLELSGLQGVRHGVRTGQSFPLNCMAASEDGKVLVTAGLGGEIAIWNTKESGDSCHFSFNRRIVGVLTNSAGTQLLVICADNCVLAVDISTGKTLSCRSNLVLDPAAFVFLREGQQVASVDRQTHSLVIWDFASGKDVLKIKLPSQFAPSLLYSQLRGGSFLAVCGSEVYSISDLAFKDKFSAKCILSAPSKISAIDVSPSAQLLAVVHADGAVGIYPSGAKEPCKIVPSIVSPVCCVYWSKDDSSLTLCGVCGDLVTFNIKTGAKAVVVPNVNSKEVLSCRGAAGQMLFIGYRDQFAVGCYELESSACLKSYFRTVDISLSVSSCDRGRIAFFGNYESGSTIWNLESGFLEQCLPAEEALNTAVSGNGEYVSFVDGGWGGIEVWNRERKQIAKRFRFASMPSRVPMALSRDGSLVAFPGDKGDSILVKGVNSGNLQATLSGFRGDTVTRLEFSKDSKSILIGAKRSISSWYLTDPPSRMGQLALNLQDHGSFQSFCICGFRQQLLVATSKGYFSDSCLDNSRDCFRNFEPQRLTSNFRIFLDRVGEYSLSRDQVTGQVFLYQFVNGIAVRLMPLPACCGVGIVRNLTGSRVCIPCGSSILVVDTKLRSIVGRLYSFENGKNWLFLSVDGRFDGSPEVVRGILSGAKNTFYSQIDGIRLVRQIGLLRTTWLSDSSLL
jgi:WD40 repeat protein